VHTHSGGPGCEFPKRNLADYLSPLGFRKRLPAFDLLPGTQAALAEAAVLVDFANIDAGRLRFILAHEDRIPIDTADDG
jgi:hypothetical protein